MARKGNILFATFYVAGLFLVFPSFSLAASEVIWYGADPVTGEIVPGSQVVLQNEGVYQVLFDTNGYFQINPDHPEYNAGNAALYFVPEDGSERELVLETEDGGTPVVWMRVGTYEIDVYGFVLAPMRAPQSWWSNIVQIFIPQRALAAPQGEYVDTIRFTISEAEPPCCSSVLFLPGIQGSILKEGSSTRWPPTVFSQDVERLEVTESGESVNSIQVGGILNSFYGTPIYGGYTEFMDGLVDEGVINEWSAFSYDWRIPFQTTIEEGVVREGEDEAVMIVQTIENLAANSKTGRVTIIAHSMGGLLGKLLIQERETQGLAHLVDSFVMVGTPQLGTPQAIASLLHGDQPIIMNVFVKSHVLRSTGRNMQTTHALLPSRKYFEEVTDPVISFSSDASFTQDWIGQWGATIDSYDEFKEFVTDSFDLRSRPTETNLAQPEILIPEVVEIADTTHSVIDEYEFPPNMRVVQVIGWGLPTVKNVTYKNKHVVFEGYETKITNEGDNTVVFASAQNSDLENYYLNLSLINNNSGVDFDHKNLMGSIQSQNLISGILRNADSSESIEYVSTQKPAITEIQKQLMVTVRSPIILGVEDSSGRFTGINPNQDLTADVLQITREIPGSSFFVFGEDQYLVLPEKEQYAFKLHGIGSGPATIQISSLVNDQTTPIVTYSDIGVSEESIASFEVNSQGIEDTKIDLDQNGDGNPDTTILPDGYSETPTLEQLILSLKSEILALNVKEALKKKLLKKVEGLEKRIQKQKNHKASITLVNLERKIAKKTEKGSISNAEAEVVLNLLDEIGKAL